MIFDSKKMLLIAGPCAIESRETCRAVAEVLKSLEGEHEELNVVFKSSFDKANRTSLKGDRGMGMEAGLEILAGIKEEFGLKIVTDIHSPEQAKRVGEVVDVVQIPAFLCRQTDLLVAAAGTGKTVFVKKGQFLSPQEMEHVVGKLRDSGAAEVWQADRGTFFGYGNLVVDMRSFPIMKGHGCPAIIDGTHCVQLPGAAGGKSGGQREFVAPLAKAAIAAGADGAFIETHPKPEEAISDGPNQIHLEDFGALVEDLLRVWRAVRTHS